MAYGFNLGQIEGLDSSVKTVTLTIANATESNTYTLTYNVADDYWGFSSDTRNIELYLENQYILFDSDLEETDVGDTYNVTLSVNDVEENFKSAVETVLVDNGLISEPDILFDGTITITEEDTQGVEIPFDMDVSSYPFEKWTVTVNGLEIPYQADEQMFILADDNIGYSVYDNDGVYMFQVINIQDDSYPPVPGDYQVLITVTTSSGGALPSVTIDDTGSVLGVKDNGVWGVDDRFKYLPSPGSPGSPDASISGSCLASSRGEKFIWKQINPIPLTTNVKTEAEIYLPIHYRGVATTEYVQVRPHGAAQYNNGGSLFLLLNDLEAGEDVNPAFVEITPPNLSLGGSGSYSLRATITRGTDNDSNKYTYNFQWVPET